MGVVGDEITMLGLIVQDLNVKDTCVDDSDIHCYIVLFLRHILQSHYL